MTMRPTNNVDAGAPTTGNTRMHTEPARTIGEIFANKTMIQPVVSAIVAIVALVFKFVVSDQLIDDITTVVVFVAVVWGAFSAQQEQARLAREQAEQTREAVYSPATTKALVEHAAETGEATKL